MSQDRGRLDCVGCRATHASPDDSRALAPVEDGIGRRTFLVQSGILAAMAALAACGASSDATAPNVPANSAINVGDFPSLANVGGVALVSLGGAPLAIVRTSSTSFIALSRVCPHQGSIVGLNNSGFLCPNHGAQFDSTGQWIGGQPTSNMHQYATTYDATSNTLTIS